MNIDSLQGGMKTLNNSFDDMKNGGETATEAFKRLKLSADDLEGMTREEMFEATVTALQGVSDESERAALANDLFGRSGAEMAPLLNQSAESVEALKQQAKDMGMVMGDDAVNSATALTDTMDALNRSGGGLMNMLGAALMPVLQQVLDVVMQNMPMIQEMISQLAPILADVFSKLLPPLMDLVTSLLPPLLDLFGGIMPVLGEIMDAIMPVIIDLLNMLLPPIIEIVKALLPVLISLIKPLLPLLQPILALLQPFIDLLMILLEPLLDLINMILPPLISLFTQVMNRILPPLNKAFGFLADTLGGALKGAFEAVKPIVENIIGVFSGITDFIKNVFTGNWRGAWDAIVKIFSNIFNGIKNIFKIPINWIIGGINAFIGGLNKLKIPDWVPVVGGKGINIKKIPKLKVGMDYVPSDDFPALLHKGERVLTAEENKEYRNGGQSGQIVIQNMSVRNDTDINKIAQELFRLQQRQLRAKGAPG